MLAGATGSLAPAEVVSNAAVMMFGGIETSEGMTTSLFWHLLRNPAQLAALRAIHQLVEDSSQFIIATHSPILLAYPHAKIIQFDGSGISEVAFEDTEHFAVIKDFPNNYPRRLGQLLADEEPEGSGA